MAELFRRNANNIQCLLCPHNCKIREGHTGICGVRKNSGGSSELITYGVLSGYALDPIEKKPLYHFFPGSNILSLGSYGCNMKCDFCQNYNISQRTLSSFPESIGINKIISDALSSVNNTGIAFTYNEPVIWFEFIRDVSVHSRLKGLKTVLVSNGYVNPDPLKEIITFTDAFNIDLKAFNPEFYRELTGAEIEPVKETIKMISRSGKHLEITTLIIPEHNDSEDEMALEAEWIANECGRETPLHISRYFPMFRRDDPPTDHSVLRKLFKVASEYLDYVYIGNISLNAGNNTVCPVCSTTVTERSGYSVRQLNIDVNGCCRICGKVIYRHFNSFPVKN